jgi:hypothetical protein
MAKADIRLHVHVGEESFIVASVAQDDRIISRINFEIETDQGTSGELASRVIMTIMEWVAQEIARHALHTDTPKPKDD